jgi:Kef-type K+ transport system membrane component KefB
MFINSAKSNVYVAAKPAILIIVIAVRDELVVWIMLLIFVLSVGNGETVSHSWICGHVKHSGCLWW